MQRPEYPETPEPALGSTKAFSQDDEVPLGKPTATTCCGCSYDGTTAAAAMMVRPLLSRSAQNFCHLQQKLLQIVMVGDMLSYDGDDCPPWLGAYQ